MIESAIRGFISSFTPVMVLDADVFGILFHSASPMRVSVRQGKRATKFQVETGEVRNDHIIDLPTEIVVDFLMSGNEARTQFANLVTKYEAKEPVIIQTRLTSYSNMLIESIDREEVAAIAEGSTMTVRFIEWREITPEYGELTPEKTQSPKHTDTVNRGKVTGKDVPDDNIDRGTSAYRLYTGVKSLWD